ncbi:MAG: tRNA ((1)-)-methyltransferase [Francisellaceae bacterium]|nr:tRNA ((1)-)-methyltransferase [Francisellaceae bacterium]
MFQALTEYGITGRAFKRGLIEGSFFNPRDFATDLHKTVDDRPYGGGPGMVMKVAPLREAIKQAKQHCPGSVLPRLIYLSPQGKPLTQSLIQVLSRETALIFVAARYEGLDERLMQCEPGEEYSLGDFVISGGELAVMVLMDAIIRLIPGSLNESQSVIEDSFQEGLLDCPHYTRPKIYEDLETPAVLLSGNHIEIKRWRLKEKLGHTWLKRPDLLKNRILSDDEQSLLDEFIAEYKPKGE